MNIILQERLKDLGDIGDQVAVKSGYARNYLLPKGIAVIASKDNIANFEHRRIELEKLATEKREKAKARAESLADLSLKIQAKASDEGKLFGSVGPREIVKAFHALGIEVTKQEITLSQGAIRRVGEFPIELHLHTDVVCHMMIHVLASCD